jgi:ssDNA-binding Zn-finger/Zn-ribbon topoisomerase 1
MPDPAPVCPKCGAALVIKSRGAFNYVGCPTCISAKKATKEKKQRKPFPKAADGRGSARPPAAPPRKPPQPTPVPKTPHWLDDYV